MKDTLLLMMLFSFISCSNNTVQGIWVSSYYQNEEGVKFLPIAAKKVIEFSHDSIHIRGVRSFPHTRYNGKYLIDRNILEISSVR